MGIRIGPYDPIQLTFNVINELVRKGTLTTAEARNILKVSLPSEWTDQQKEELLNQIIRQQS